MSSMMQNNTETLREYDNQNRASSYYPNNYSSNRRNNHKQNRKNRNRINNDVAPLKPQNHNQTSNHAQNNNIKHLNNGSNRYYRRKAKQYNKQMTNNQVETISQLTDISYTPARLNQSLNNDESKIPPTLATSISLDNMVHLVQETPVEHNLSTSESNFETPIKLEEDNHSTESPNEQIDDLKQLSFSESESSLEFMSCCSTPMADMRENENHELVISENVIKALDFKSNDILAFDNINSLNQSSEDNEVTCIDTDFINYSNTQEQLSVIQTKEFSPENGDEYDVNLNSFESSSTDSVLEDIVADSVAIENETFNNLTIENVDVELQNCSSKSEDKTQDLVSFIRRVVLEELITQACINEQEHFVFDALIKNENSRINEIEVQQELKLQIQQENMDQALVQTKNNNQEVENQTNMEEKLILENDLDPQTNDEKNEKIELIEEIATSPLGNELPRTLNDEDNESVVTVLRMRQERNANIRKAEPPVDCFPCSIL